MAAEDGQRLLIAHLGLPILIEDHVDRPNDLEVLRVLYTAFPVDLPVDLLQLLALLKCVLVLPGL
jgi:hypothetical protein